MKKIFLLASAFLFFILLVLLLPSCNNNDAAAPKSGTAVTAANPAPAAVAVPANLLNGHLDTLWITAANFTALGNGSRITFRFYDTLDAFTLRGWTGNSNGWNDRLPDVKLFKGRESPVTFGQGSYFGNLQISPNQYNTIRQRLTATGATFVLFCPVNPTVPPTAGQISYNIYLTSDEPGDFSPSFKYKFVVDATGVSTNPSPPKNSN
ncbi:hypothetical protein [Ferruginibacter sp.]